MKTIPAEPNRRAVGDAIDRRRAITLAGAAAAAVMAHALPAASHEANLRPAQHAATGSERRARRRNRSAEALDLRVEAARYQDRQPRAPVRVNGDEQRYPALIAAYSKGLPHTTLGEVEPAAYAALLRAAQSGRVEDFDQVPAGGVVKLVNPLAAFAFGLDGPDAHQTALPPPPAFASAQQALEACEVYWQALTRDVPFAAYDTDPLIARAAEELARLGAHLGVPLWKDATPRSIFRGETVGDLTGPYVSQFLWKEVPYGAIRLVPHVRTATPGIDYLTTWDDWLQVQNGAATVSRHAGTYRYIRSARDLAAYVQLDFTYQPFLTACLVLFGMEGTTDVRRPYKGAPFDPANPYRMSRTQSGFSTFGVAHALDLVARVANLALRATWYHKWLVHRRLRPEELGGRVHAHCAGLAKYPLHEALLGASVLDVTHERYGTYLLPQAYPEGTPMHPSYPAGHAAIAGACATVLKAFFNESFPIDEPVVARPDGLALEPYRGPQLTVGAELDKLASNVALGRNGAGIHWRSDATEGLRLGEAIALNLLTEMRGCFSEPFAGFGLTKFDGTTVSA